MVHDVLVLYSIYNTVRTEIKYLPVMGIRKLVYRSTCVIRVSKVST